MESPDRSSGILLVTSQSLKVGQNVSFTGTANRVNGEYQVHNVTILDSASGGPLAPLGLTTKTIGSDKAETLNYRGANTTGLLVRIAGEVTGVLSSQEAIYVDDGFGYQDGVGGFSGIRVQFPSSVSLPSVGDIVMMMGISRVEEITLSSSGDVNGVSCPAGTAVYVPEVWVRGAGDISDIGQK